MSRQHKKRENGLYSSAVESEDRLRGLKILILISSYGEMPMSYMGFLSDLADAQQLVCSMSIAKKILRAIC